MFNIELILSFFDQLFKPKQNKKSEPTQAKPEFNALDYMEMLKNLDNLGEPTSVTTEDLGDGFIGVTKIWERPTGNIKLTSVEPNFGSDESNLGKEDDLEKELQKAIDSEDYLRAAQLRDKIKNKK